MKKYILVLFALLLGGCQAIVYGTASEFQEISLGMSKAQVIETMGSPVSVGANADLGEEYLVYKKMKHAISAWPRTYVVTLREGKVIKYGEQYDELNINMF